jgi:hypothetical protein
MYLLQFLPNCFPHLYIGIFAVFLAGITPGFFRVYPALEIPVTL